jgi:hypothetical protein
MPKPAIWTSTKHPWGLQEKLYRLSERDKHDDKRKRTGLKPAGEVNDPGKCKL